MTQVKENPVAEAPEDVKQLSKEEIAKRKQEVSNFYKENIKHLKIQKEYEGLLTEIEELRAKRLQAQMFQAQSYKGMEGEVEDHAPEEDFQQARKTLKRT